MRHRKRNIPMFVAALACITAPAAALDLAGFSVSAPRVNPGEVLRITGQPTGASGPVSLSITTPYAIPVDLSPVNFTYDNTTKRPVYTARQPDGSFAIDTTGWAPGLYHLTLEARSGSTVAYRDFAVKVGMADELYKIDVEYDGPIGHGGGGLLQNFERLHNGGIIAGVNETHDGGETWQIISNRGIPFHTQLSDGRIIGLDAFSEPHPTEDGVFTTRLHWSTDQGRDSSRRTVNLYVPDAIPGVAHTTYNGPVIYRSIVEMPDGRLLASAYGRFEGDNTPWRWTLNPESTRTRAIVLESNDGGQSWQYLSTIAYDDEIGMEGYNETVLKLLPNGDLLALSRTGDNAHVGWEDNPIMMMRSTDGGHTWSTPQRTGAYGVAPDLAVLSDGTLVSSYGRPGHNIMFSPDNGQTWVQHTSIEPERYRGYTAVIEVEPGVLMVGYRARNWLNPETGQRVTDVTRVTRLRIRRWGEGVLYHDGFAAEAPSAAASLTSARWFHDAALTAPAAVEIAPESLNAPSGYGLTMTDGRLIGRGSDSHHTVFTALPESAHIDLGSSQAYYLSLLVRRTHAGDGSESFDVTLSDGQGHDVMFAVSSSGRPTILTDAGNASGAASVGFEQTYLLVGCILASETGVDAIALRLFHEDEVVPLMEPTQWDATFAGWSSDAVLDRVGLGWGTHTALEVEFDELRLATTWEEALMIGAAPVPEPATAACAVLGLSYIIMRRGRRENPALS